MGGYSACVDEHPLPAQGGLSARMTHLTHATSRHETDRLNATDHKRVGRRYARHARAIATPDKSGALSNFVSHRLHENRSLSTDKMQPIHTDDNVPDGAHVRLQYLIATRPGNAEHLLGLCCSELGRLNLTFRNLDPVRGLQLRKASTPRFRKCLDLDRSGPLNRACQSLRPCLRRSRSSAIADSDRGRHAAAAAGKKGQVRPGALQRSSQAAHWDSVATQRAGRIAAGEWVVGR